MDEDKTYRLWVEGAEDGFINIYLDPCGMKLPETFESIFGTLKPMVSPSVETGDGGAVYQLVPVNYEGEL